MLRLFLCGVWRRIRTNNDNLKGGETSNFQTFSRLNIWLIYFYLLKNETSSPKRKVNSLYAVACPLNKEVVPVLPNMHVRHFGSTVKIGCWNKYWFHWFRKLLAWRLKPVYLCWLLFRWLFQICFNYFLQTWFLFVLWKLHWWVLCHEYTYVHTLTLLVVTNILCTLKQIKSLPTSQKFPCWTMKPLNWALNINLCRS